MKISELRNYIMEGSKDKLAEREERFRMACKVSELFEKITESVAPFDFTPERLHRLALQEGARTILKIDQAFGLGLLSLPNQKVGTAEERSALYQEIIEYLQLVQTGIDSFVEAHPIKSIEGGAADNE